MPPHPTIRKKLTQTGPTNHTASHWHLPNQIQLPLTRGARPTESGSAMNTHQTHLCLQMLEA